MNRVKTFDATGVAPNGRLYAGDLNAIQDAAAALTDLTQNLSVGSLAVGEAGLQLVRYGAGEGRLTGLLRVDGVLRGLGGLVPGTFTTAARDAIAAGSRPYGMAIVNTNNNRWEWNQGTDAAPNWQPISPPIAAGSIGTTELADGSVTSAKIADGTIVNADVNAAAAIAQTKIASVLGLADLSADVNYLKGNAGDVRLAAAANLLIGAGSGVGGYGTGVAIAKDGYVRLVRAADGQAIGAGINGEANPRWQVSTVGRHEWGPGGASATDTAFERVGTGHLQAVNIPGGGYGQLDADLRSYGGGTLMRVHRHPYSSDRHLESFAPGVSHTSGQLVSSSVTFTDPFAAVASVVTGYLWSSGSTLVTCGTQSLSSTGVTAWAQNLGGTNAIAGSAGVGTICLLVEGSD